MRILSDRTLPTWPRGIVVVIASLLLEVFVTTGLLFVAGIAVVPMFFALVIGNVISYVGIAALLYEAVEIVWLVETVIVMAEASFIKLLSSFDLFQGNSFDGLKWENHLPQCLGRQRLLLLRRYIAGLIVIQGYEAMLVQGRGTVLGHARKPMAMLTCEG